MSLFLQTLSKLNKGGSPNELDAALATLTSQVRAAGRAGSLTLKLTIKPLDDYGEMVEVSDKLKIEAPPLPRYGAIFYATDDGRLSRTDPKQPDLPFSALDGVEEPKETEGTEGTERTAS